MISDVMQRQIKNLSQSVQTDANGNVKIGKNLIVDGKLYLDDINDLVNAIGAPLIKKKFRHTVILKLYGGVSKDLGCISFTDYSDSETPITDYNKLHATFGGKSIAISGHVSVYNTNSKEYMTVFPCTLDLTGGTMPTDSVYVIYPLTNQCTPIQLSAISAESMTIEDKVSVM